MAEMSINDVVKIDGDTDPSRKERPIMLGKFCKTIDKKPIQGQICDEDRKRVLIGSLGYNILHEHLSFGGLEKYTELEVKKIWKSLLNGNSRINDKIDPVSLDTPWTLEEDFRIITMIRQKKKIGNTDIINGNNPNIKLCRDLHQIWQRIQYWQEHESEISGLIEALVHNVLEEELYYISSQSITEEQKLLKLSPDSFLPSRCFYHPIDHPIISKEAENELKTLTNLTSFYSHPIFQSSDLAILRGEKILYRMKREAILLGRASLDFDVDVDLTYTGERSCVHTSRLQAIVSFMSDLNFYIQNIGNRCFRVNGEIIPPGDFGKLPSNSLLDFSDVLLVFIPNTDLIYSLEKEINAKIAEQSLVKQV